VLLLSLLRARFWFLRASLAVPAVPCAVSSPHSRRANAAAQSIHLITSLWCFLGRCLSLVCFVLSLLPLDDSAGRYRPWSHSMPLTLRLPACLPACLPDACSCVVASQAQYLQCVCRHPAHVVTCLSISILSGVVVMTRDMTAVRRLGRRALAPSHADRLHELHHQHQRQTQPHFAPTATRPYPLSSLPPYPSLTSPTVAAP
jgi:hypothetical protein